MRYPPHIDPLPDEDIPPHGRVYVNPVPEYNFHDLYARARGVVAPLQVVRDRDVAFTHLWFYLRSSVRVLRCGMGWMSSTYARAYVLHKVRRDADGDEAFYGAGWMPEGGMDHFDAWIHQSKRSDLGSARLDTGVVIPLCRTSCVQLLESVLTLLIAADAVVSSPDIRLGITTTQAFFKLANEQPTGLPVLQYMWFAIIAANVIASTISVESRGIFIGEYHSWPARGQCVSSDSRDTGWLPPQSYFNEVMSRYRASTSLHVSDLAGIKAAGDVVI